ncbi:MAG: zf-HC2 domain-containing protein [Gemmatimonadales bacterium]
MMNCDDAKRLLLDYLKQELTPEVTGEVREHLERCRPCEWHERFERNFQRLLETRLRGECCPDQLKQRIVEQLKGEK